MHGATMKIIIYIKWASSSENWNRVMASS
jgi:hypothetical protein